MTAHINNGVVHGPRLDDIPTLEYTHAILGGPILLSYPASREPLNKLWEVWNTIPGARYGKLTIWHRGTLVKDLQANGDYDKLMIAIQLEVEKIAPHLVHSAPKASLTQSTNEKPTNPKDAIGIRKAPMSTVPMNVLVEIGIGMLEGASKYGRHNYRCAGVRSSVYFDATMRHLIAWWEGEDIDPDSGMPHISKALCSLVVLRDAQMQSMITDDRPPRSAPFYPAMNEKAIELIEKHAAKHPRHYTIDDTGLKV